MPGTTVAAARTDIVSAGRIVNATYPDEGGGTWRAAGYTLQELRVDPMVARSVLVLAVAVSLLLLIACVNVANLLLARAAARRREMAVRLAIGAGSGRLVRQLLTESAVLSAAGAIAGLLLAAAAVRALSTMAPLAAANLSSVRGTLTAISLGGIALDGRAAAVAVIVALFTGLVAGVIPALAAARLPVADAMRQGAVATSGADQARSASTTRGSRLPPGLPQVAKLAACVGSLRNTWSTPSSASKRPCPGWAWFTMRAIRAWSSSDERKSERP
jgi:hypothetical protein